jgi:hypothetical protein
VTLIELGFEAWPLGKLIAAALSFADWTPHCSLTAELPCSFETVADIVAARNCSMVLALALTW